MGAGGGGGGGYDTSVSWARTDTQNPVFFNPTYFNFNSPDSQDNAGGVQADPTATATATSATARGGNASATSVPTTLGSGASQTPPSLMSSGGGGIPIWAWILIGVAGIFVVLKFFHKP